MKRRFWTIREIDRLRELYPNHPRRVVARMLGRPETSIKTKTKALRLHRGRAYIPWTAEEIADLRALYPNAWPPDLVRRFRRPMRKIHAAANHYGIKKAPEFIRLTGRISARHPHAVAARFAKGHVPANKGLRRPGWFRGRMRETQFKKGHRPYTWLPVGTIKANTDGYLRMKVRDDSEAVAGKGASSTNWMFVHKMVWESAHDPIPPGHRIWWKDGNHNNCALENLELLTDQEHMRRTTIQNLPPTLKRAILMQAALNRKIRRLEEDGEKQALGSARPPVRNPRSAQGQRAAHGA